MDNVLVDFRSAFPKVPADVFFKFKDRLDEVPGIFSLMEPMEHAISSYIELATKFDTYILSTSPWNNPSAWSDKLVWVQKYLGQAAHKRLILSHHKDLNIGHFLIDDRTKNGTDQFQGEHIPFGEDPFLDWPAVVCYLNERTQ
jgi:5'(3')-deoxyribonucleotidase